MDDVFFVNKQDRSGGNWCPWSIGRGQGTTKNFLEGKGETRVQEALLRQGKIRNSLCLTSKYHSWSIPHGCGYFFDRAQHIRIFQIFVYLA